MKRFIFATIAASATIFFAAGCQEKNEMAPTETSDRNVITASIPEAITRVSMNAPADGKGLALAWEASDELTVIGVNSTEQFTIADGFTAHNAQFNGTAVDGDSFTVIYPGQTYKTLDEINAVSYLEQKQTGNGNTDHLFYHAMVETSDYTSLDFSKAKQNGVIKFLFQLPSEATVVESVTLSATDAIFYATNYLDGEKTNSLTLDLEDVDVSASEQMLTAYMMISWNDVALPADSKLTITVNMPDSKFEQVLTVPETGLTILSGKVNTFGLNDKSWTEPLFFGGNGTEADPYQIKSYTHLDNVRKVINAETKTWFVMVDDIDMAGKNWTMYNGSTGNVYRYDFNGNDHTISNFSMTRSGASFFGALTGGAKVHDLKFNKVVLSDEEGGSNSVGTVSYNIIDGTVDNVDITDATITSATSDGNNTGTGAIASRLYTGSISNCDVENLTMNTTAERVGGIIGVNAEDEGSKSITNCTIKNAKIEGINHVGGIVGRSATAKAIVISNCDVLGTDNVIKGAASVGGIIGESGGVATISNCDVTGTSITCTGDATGGIAGYVNKDNSSINGCTVSDAQFTTVSRTGGIVGRIGGSTGAVTIYNCTVTAMTATASGQFLGGVCGRNHKGSGVSIYGCKVNDLNLSSTFTTNNTDRANVGGIVGQSGGNITIYRCSATGSIDAKSTNIGGIIGATGGATYTDNEIYECTWNGTLAAGGRTGGILGYVEGAVDISDCYTAGTLNRSAWSGGIVGWNKAGANTSIISNCYSTINITQSGNGIGGIVGGLDSVGSGSTADDAFRGTVEKCIAWNNGISSSSATSGCIVGASALKNTLKDCWRKPGMTTGFEPADQDNKSESSPLTSSARAYHGKAAGEGETVSSIAQTKLDWSGDIWDFTTALPTLKNLPK